MTKTAKKSPPPVLAPGHSACAGCGQLMAVRNALEAAGRDIIVVNATGCLEVTTTPWPTSSFGVPWVHSLFENAAAVASGVLASLTAQKNTHTRVIAQGGDGSTFDIGFGLISGMWERQDDILYICYDNEGYMNTGYQSSGATLTGASTTTAPSGSQATGHRMHKKNLPRIAMAHNIPYTATATVADLPDLQRKVKKAMTFTGPRYIQIMTPCVPGWKISPSDTLEVAQKGVSSGLYPVFEAEHDQITQVHLPPTGKKQTKVEEFLRLQGRFRHLFSSPEGRTLINQMQEIANQNLTWLKKASK